LFTFSSYDAYLAGPIETGWFDFAASRPRVWRRMAASHAKVNV